MTPRARAAVEPTGCTPGSGSQAPLSTTGSSREQKKKKTAINNKHHHAVSGKLQWKGYRVTAATNQKPSGRKTILQYQFITDVDRTPILF